MEKKEIGIVGLGLMGGSFSLALKNKIEKMHIVGFDHNQAHCEEALKLGLADEVTQDLERIKQCDIIILAIPVDGIISVAKQLEGIPKETTVIDFGSTKEIISQSIPASIRSNFVTAHPMAGTEKFGPYAAMKELYKEKVVVLCDIEKSGDLQKKTAKSLFETLEMKLVYMGAKEHDRHAAYISHMPHAISYSLANAVMKQEARESIVALAGGGFKDMSRIAKSSPSMWEDVFRQNKNNLLEAINSFQSELKKCQKMIEHEEWDNLNEWMYHANKLHDILD